MLLHNEPIKAKLPTTHKVALRSLRHRVCVGSLQRYMSKPEINRAHGKCSILEERIK